MKDKDLNRKLQQWSRLVQNGQKFESGLCSGEWKSLSMTCHRASSILGP